MPLLNDFVLAFLFSVTDFSPFIYQERRLDAICVLIPDHHLKFVKEFLFF